MDRWMAGWIDGRIDGKGSWQGEWLGQVVKTISQSPHIIGQDQGAHNLSNICKPLFITSNQSSGGQFKSLDIIRSQSYDDSWWELKPSQLNWTFFGHDQKNSLD